MIPAFNEAETIGDVIRQIPHEINGVDEIRIIVVNDGSTDNTSQKADADYIIHHPSNMGLGQSFIDGIKKALEIGADIIVNIDADGQHDPSDIPRLLNPILVGDCDIVIGSRYMNSSKLEMPKIKDWGNRFFTKIVSWAIGKPFSDTQSGFRAYSREAILNLTLFSKFTYTQETLIDLSIKGMRIMEVPITIKPRRGKSRIVKNWYTYGFKALAIVLQTLRDNRPLAFFGTLGIIALLMGFSTGIFIFAHWFMTGRTFPYTSLIDFVVLSSLIGLFLMVLALVADMQGRQRKIQEEMLYYIKHLHYDSIAKDPSETKNL